MADISVTVKGKLVHVKCPYSEDFNAGANDLNGRFDKPSTTWTFDSRDTRRVRDLLIKVFGSEGSSLTQTVDIRVDLAKFHGTDYHQVVVAGRKVAVRPGRDMRVRLNHAVVISGGFDDAGGSVKNPQLRYREGTVLEVRDVPAGHPDVTSEGVTIVSESIDVDALAAERERLTLRIAEIDRLLQ